VEKEERIRASDICKVEICPDNHAIWLVHFHHESDELSPYVSKLIPETHLGEGSDPQAGHQSLAGINHTFDKQKDFPPVFDLSNMKHIKNEEVEDGVPMIYVGIVDRISHQEENFDRRRGSHADVLAKIINHSKCIKPISIPMLPHADIDNDEEATLFDLICALSRKADIDKVQIINISQGFKLDYQHSVLKRVLRDIHQPILCSAGNSNKNNDENGHWPSNFSTEYTNVIAVTCIDDGDNYWNYGDKTVNTCATGSWGNHHTEIKGTSFATAWMSRMFALAFAKKRRINMTLHDVQHALEDLYDISYYDTVRTSELLKFSNDEPEEAELTTEKIKQGNQHSHAN
ncbi:MAG: S8/S53 family peptidase, partial [Saprospiraceae bacterium]|nr:S8/S53 family peptidase [Saprospiraceae bacterium]